MSLFKGNEVLNDEGIISILGMKRGITTWDLARQPVIEEKMKGPKCPPDFEPSYAQKQSRSSVVFKRIKRLISDEYVVESGKKISKGNPVPVYCLTFKGLIASAYLSKDEDLDDIIGMNYNYLVESQYDRLLQYHLQWGTPTGPYWEPARCRPWIPRDFCGQPHAMTVSPPTIAAPQPLQTFQARRPRLISQPYLPP